MWWHGEKSGVLRVKRIGIVGTDSTHASAYAGCINGMPADEARVVAIWGETPTSARALADQAGISHCVAHPLELLGTVDAVMITVRDGATHLELALPFIQAGCPVYVDKPFALTGAQASALAGAAKRARVPLMGGSGCKYLRDVLAARDTARAMMMENALLGACISFSVSMDSPFGGFLFYAPHLIEIALTVLGAAPRQVYAVACHGTVTATARFENCDVTMHFLSHASRHGYALFGPRDICFGEIGLGGLYHRECELFMRMLHTGEMPESYERLVQPVFIAEAIMKSIAKKEPVEVEGWNDKPAWQGTGTGPG
ncbi:Gfo/Idh/MocA family oxidoreductase [Ruminococcaceae bacterium OttesenSCG-928-D13]|nr:Gfo/Idh/MocA family oxidoreductase [Ruminococcaceae bacterium OttesenSCG-928-D13]